MGLTQAEEVVGSMQSAAQASVDNAINLAAEREITALMLRAARLADDRDYLGWLDLFVDEGRYGAATFENFSSGGLHLFKDKSKLAIHERVSFLMGLWQVPRGKTSHLVTNIELQIDEAGRTATGRSNFLMTRTADLEHSKLHACGRYEDRFERRDGTWMFSERMVIVDSNMLPPEFTELL